MAPLQYELFFFVLGGQFTPARGGQFGPAPGGHIKPASGGQYHRHVQPGPSSVLSKAVIEVFAKRFLVDPALVFLSESGNKVIAQDNDLAASIGLKIEADRNLPDIILADLGAPSPLIIFVEVVHSDGPISTLRKNVLLKLGTDAGFNKNSIVFVSVFSDKSTAAFKRLSSDIAWGSFVWFSAEPENILIYRDKETLENKALFELVK